LYYLLECLHADPLAVVKGITVSNETYTLIWDTLVDRYDKSRKLASSIIDKLLTDSITTSKNLLAYRTFLLKFDENIAIL